MFFNKVPGGQLRRELLDSNQTIASLSLRSILGFPGSDK
jgi:hypothetical protein